MRGIHLSTSFLLGASMLALGCATSNQDIFGGTESSTSSSASSGPGGSGSGGGAGVGGADAGTGGGGSDGTGGSAPATLRDPNSDGPYRYSEVDIDRFVAPTTGDNVPIYCAFPNDAPTPLPIVVIAHGFQLEPNQYKSYAQRLATFGYVAIVPNFPSALTFGAPDNVTPAKDLIDSLAWATSYSELAGKVDIAATGAGITGHSLGGKLAILAATMDPRFKAAIVLDPVDGAPGNPLNPNPACTDPCVDVSEELPISIPTAFIGETIAAAGVQQSPPIPSFPPCAPEAENYATFYAKAGSPSLEVTVVGASHMSFLDNAECGFTCDACAPATVPDADVNALARAYVVAFFERYLRNSTGYDTYLTGAEAQALKSAGVIDFRSK